MPPSDSLPHLGQTDEDPSVLQKVKNVRFGMLVQSTLLREAELRILYIKRCSIVRRRSVRSCFRSPHRIIELLSVFENCKRPGASAFVREMLASRTGSDRNTFNFNVQIPKCHDWMPN